MKELFEIQQALKAPKNQFNKFGNYKYRSCEDILEALKPHLKKHGCTLVISDDMVNVGDRVYVKASVTIKKGDDTLTVNGFAREAVERKGMDDSQITGSASSYARKYALNGMFLIDDTKDADSTNTHGKEEKKEELKPGHPRWEGAVKAMKEGSTTLDEIEARFFVNEGSKQILLK